MRLAIYLMLLIGLVLPMGKPPWARTVDVIVAFSLGCYIGIRGEKVHHS